MPGVQEVIEALINCNLEETFYIKSIIDKRIESLKKREALVEHLSSFKDYSGHAAVQREREKSVFGV